MIDQSSIQILNIAEKYVPNLRKSGRVYVGACPVCKEGTDRFTVKPLQNTWVCRRGHGGDPVGLVMAVEGVDFKTAVERLGLNLPENQRPQRFTPKPPPPPVRLSEVANDKAYLSREWQESAERFVDECVCNLMGAKERNYLMERGLKDFSWHSNMLGFNPEARYQQWGDTRVWLPSGIVIPWEIDRAIWNIRIRTFQPKQPKYISAAGGTALGLYHGTLVRPGQVVLLVEGEFDAILAQQEANAAKLPVRAVATGGVGNARLLRWVSLLSLARRVLVAFDTDSAGETASSFWLEALPHNARRYLPTCHDVTDMWQAHADIASWLRGGIA